MGLQLVTPPAVEPLSLADLKAQCRIDDASEDALLALIIAAARAKAESYTGGAIIRQEWVQTIDAFPASSIQLLKTPAASITSVTYVDAAGATQTLAPAAYAADLYTFPGWLLPAFGAEWPVARDMANAVSIRYFAGYADAISVPADMRAWLLLTAGFLYAQREAFVLDGKVAEIPARFVDSLLDPYRVFEV